MIRAARADEVEAIQRIEAEAAKRFWGLGLIDHALGDVTPAQDLLAAIAEGRVWVVAVDDVAVGYAAATAEDGFAYLQEMDVLPEFGRRGFGRQLVEHVCGWARGAGYDTLLLTTFRDVPWNGPFYERLGFELVDRTEWTPAMARICRHEEEEMRLPWADRAFYRKGLGVRR